MKTGWVIKDKKTKKYYGSIDGNYCTHTLMDATVIDSRQHARDTKMVGKEPKNETVCKVALNKNGKPYKVLNTGQ